MKKERLVLLDEKDNFIELIVAEKLENGKYKTSKGNFNEKLIGLGKMKGFKLSPITDEIMEKLADEKYQKELEEAVKDNRFLRPAPPSRQFKVGDKVSYGNFKDATIEAVVTEDLLYLVNYTHVESVYGKNVERKNLKKIVPWIRLFHLTNSEIEDFHRNFRIKLDFYKASINSLLHEFYLWGIDMEPEYQRDYVWDDENRECLIDSIFKGIEIGKFILIEKSDSFNSKYYFEVLDGKQRLSTIVDFYEDRLRYKGLLFSELSDRDRIYFLERFQVTLAVSRDDFSLKERYELFIRHNQQGVVMDKKHLEQVVEKFNTL